jgi:hypothetical protein
MNPSSSPSGESAYTSNEAPYETRASQYDIISPNLADQPDTPIRTESPLYTPLQGSEIRLVSIQKARPDGILRCNLFHAPLTKDLEFHALSYTWGDLNHKQTIIVNDQPFQVNQNLHDFLDQIRKMKDLSTRGEGALAEPSADDLFRREYLSIYGEEMLVAPSTEAVHWWIDAICINQDDVDEKSEQVPRMRQLYSSASQVWVWLGLPQTLFPDHSDWTTLQLALRKGFAKQWSDANERGGNPAVLAPQLNTVCDIYTRTFAREYLGTMQLESQASGSRPNFTKSVVPEFQGIVEAIKAGISENGIREEAGFPRISRGEEPALPFILKFSDTFLSEVMKLFGYLVTNPWFERTWIIQEFVLGRNPPIALIGDYPFHFSNLSDLSTSIFRNSPTMGNMALTRYRMMEDKIGKILSLEGAYLARRVSEVSLSLGKVPRSSPAHELSYLLRLFIDKQSTIPHDRVYGMLGLLNGQLPEYLKPDYKLSFERVCQDYARFIIEATQDLQVIEARKSELEACPSWVPDLRYLTAKRKLHTAPAIGAIRFSADGQQLTVKGISIGKVLSCSCNHPKATVTIVDRLRMINDDILTGSARLTQRPLEVIFTTWFKTMLVQNFEFSLDSVSDIQTMGSLISGYTTDLVKLEKHFATQPPPQIKLYDYVEGIELYHMVFFLMSPEYCLLETGEIAICQLKKSEPQTRHHEEDAVWALKGCERLSILRPAEDGYFYAGSCQVLRPDPEHVPLAAQSGVERLGRGLPFKLDGVFFAGKQLEEVTLV